MPTAHPIRWEHLPQPSDSELGGFLAHTKQLKLKPLISKLLWQRGIRDADSATTFLDPKFSNLETSFEQLYDTKGAAELILSVGKTGARFFIYGDYDVDGITSTSMLWSFLYRELKLQALPFVPHRSRQGYGLNLDYAHSWLQKELYETTTTAVLILVDTGIREGEAIAELKKTYKNLKVVVVDHHEFPVGADSNNPLPEADTLVHPLHEKSTLFPHEQCTGALVWQLLAAIKAKQGREIGTDHLDLAALATVADMMPLTGINRIIVKYGLEQLEKTDNLGLRQLIEVANIKKPHRAYQLGFQIGPRINAAGRIGEPLQAVRLLSTTNFGQAQALARELDQLNRKRQQLTQTALKQLHNNIELDSLHIDYDESWEEGIIGLIAGKVQDRQGIPALAITKLANGREVGSARSNDSLHITDFLERLKDYLDRFGGHAQAAGFTLKPGKLAEFMQAAQNLGRELIDSEKLGKKIKIAGQLKAPELSLELVDQLSLLEPFGLGNPEPEFLLADLVVSEIKTLGASGDHLKLFSPDFPAATEALWFSAPKQITPGRYSFVGSLGSNTWNGQTSCQFKIARIYS